jgi:hypothetical protein
MFPASLHVGPPEGPGRDCLPHPTISCWTLNKGPSVIALREHIWDLYSTAREDGTLAYSARRAYAL